MDIEKFERMAKSIIDDINKKGVGHFTSNDNPLLYAKIKNLIFLSDGVLPEHSTFLNTIWERWDFSYNKYGTDTISIIEYLLELLKLEKRTEERIAERKIFDSAHEKIKQASLSFEKDDKQAVINNLNTALELMLKDKLGIPITITKIDTSNVIDVLAKNKKGPYAYLQEARKHISLIDNKIKHQGYSPSKIDCINALKAIEDLESRLKDNEIELEEEIRNKIYEGL